LSLSWLLLLVAYYLTFYYSLSSKCITKPYRGATVDLLLGVGYIGRGKLNTINTTSGVVAQQINFNYILRFTIKRKTIWVGTVVL